MKRPAAWSRRELLAFGWLPFFRPKHIAVAGARFRILRNGRSTRHYLHIHGNEDTAREVLERHMETHEGIAFLVENQTRNLMVEGLQLDPNRMFSRVGTEISLKGLNPDSTPEQREAAQRTLDRGREHLLSAFLPPPMRGVLIAVHNNSEQYSVMDETPISDAASLREAGNPHAFFLCTDPMDFAVLSQSPYNAVLQQKKPEEDDGSLSRLAARRSIRYVNLEVRLGNKDRQTEMLRWLDWNLP
ncbi:MAG: hypothetical protein C5B51_04960 [Terriglobia bacterium]|nr:MAG: hypothetical protein C5B51_04960 [Terriglobia bacterium]